MESASRIGVLKHGDYLVPKTEPSDNFLLSKILQDSFFDRASRSGASPPKRANKDDNAPLSQLLHQTV